MTLPENFSNKLTSEIFKPQIIFFKAREFIDQRQAMLALRIIDKSGYIIDMNKMEKFKEYIDVWVKTSNWVIDWANNSRAFRHSIKQIKNNDIYI